MQLPAFVAEIGRPSWRSKLAFGVRSGYALATAFLLLAFVAGETGIVPHLLAFYSLVGLKLFTNALAHGALVADRGVLTLHGLNTVMDVLVMTGAIHYTGGPLSPLFVVYVIAISVVALLSNRGVTLVVAGLAAFCHASSIVLQQLGWISSYPLPGADVVELSNAQALLAIVYGVGVLAVTTFFVTRLAGQLQGKTRELERRTEELIEAGTQKSHFMANVTHELRTPIHGICGLTDLLDAELYGPISEEQREAHRGIRESAGGLLRMVDDLLTLAKAEAGRLALRPAQVDLDELLTGVVASVRWMVGTKQLSLELDTDERAAGCRDRMLVTDRGRLNQTLVNLLANAVKFTPEGGRVVLRLRTTRDAVCIEVEDTGIGIGAADQQRIFEPFRQADGSDERAYGGVGLGLSLVSRLVDALQGELEVESELGLGSCFRLTLPWRLAASEPAKRSSLDSGERQIA